MLVHIRNRSLRFVHDNYMPALGTVYDWKPVSWYEYFALDFTIIKMWAKWFKYHLTGC